MLYISQISPTLNDSSYFDLVFSNSSKQQVEKRNTTSLEVLKTNADYHLVKARTSVNSSIGTEVITDIAKIPRFKESVFGESDRLGIKGLIGNVYRLQEGTENIPNFESMTPISCLVTSKIDIPITNYNAGFPGVPELFEWFGIQYRGKIKLPVSGQYEFKLVSDDGAILYIDRQKIVDNDGTHQVAIATSSVNFKKGEYPLVLDYFQGPRWLVALQLYWKKPGSETFEIIPSEQFTRGGAFR